MTMHTDIMQQTRLTKLVAARDQALATMTEASTMLCQAYDKAQEASEQAKGAHNGAGFYLNDRTGMDHYQRLFQGDFDAQKSMELYRKHLDACTWTHIIDSMGINTLMDKTAKEEVTKALLDDVPELTLDNVCATVEQLFADSELIFQRGIARCFSELDRRFKTHNGFKIGSKIILDRVFNDWGTWNYSSGKRDTICDIERTFAILDGVHPQIGMLIKCVERDRRGATPQQSVTTTDYFRAKGFKNGNLHLHFERDDLVEKVNKVLADFYGEVIGDAMTKDQSAESLRDRPGLPAKDLAFYPTPQPVVDEVFRDLCIKEGAKVLEPSAGTGAIVKTALSKKAEVHAVEIHPDRANMLEAINHDRLTVTNANFLQMPADPIYDYVLMNPPFAGTHWMDHIIHAFEFLKDGGILIAVVPASMEVNESRKHNAFREWAGERKLHWGYVKDLPAESFASVGTRINTVLLKLMKK